MKDPLPLTYEQTKDWIQNIHHYWPRKLIACQYATGCRIGELTKYKHKDGTITYGLRNEKITEFPDYWRLNFPVFKKRKNLHEPCYLSKNETWLMKQITPLFKEKDFGFLFPFSYGSAIAMVRKETSKLGFDEGSQIPGKKFSSHNIRATRISHLINYFNYNLIEAQKQVRLSRMDTLPHYYKSDHEQRLKKIASV